MQPLLYWCNQTIAALYLLIACSTTIDVNQVKSTKHYNILSWTTKPPICEDCFFLRVKCGSLLSKWTWQPGMYIEFFIFSTQFIRELELNWFAHPSSVYTLLALRISQWDRFRNEGIDEKKSPSIVTYSTRCFDLLLRLISCTDLELKSTTNGSQEGKH